MFGIFPLRIRAQAGYLGREVRITCAGESSILVGRVVKINLKAFHKDHTVPLKLLSSTEEGLLLLLQF